MPDSLMLERLVRLFSVIFFAVGLLCLPLFEFNVCRYIRSSLFIKVLFWVPLFLVFLFALYADSAAQLMLVIAVILAGLAEYFRAMRGSRAARSSIWYVVLFVVGTCHFFLLGHAFASTLFSLLTVICFSTVLSDVCAFFFGKYLGKHPLPAWVNSGKSWEGVGGQLVGALIGVLLVHAFVTGVTNIWIFLPLGLGSILGDLANSVAKRNLGIKDWARTIPGHGGFLDRFSSMAGSVSLVFYFLIVG